MNTLPILISMGCPAGIGPEIIVRLFTGHTAWRPDSGPPAIVVGSRDILARAMQAIHAHNCTIRPWQPGEPAPAEANTIPVYEPEDSAPEYHAWGKPNAASGRAMAHYIEESVRLIQKNRASALVTCPISKFSLKEAGYKFPGHTEMLASLTRTKEVHMMMAGPKLKVVLATIHESLKCVPGLLNPERVCAAILATSTSLVQDFGMERPRIAVAALNPHAGEQGLFGNEENTIIRPALALAQSLAPEAEISGPWPPDTLFYQAVQGKYDAVVCMYHDQGLIPFKLVHFDDGVNVTLGLPIVRTSVDHGTAYDIAGKGLAKADSLAAAISMAQEIVSNRELG